MNKYLLDTHIFLWALLDPSCLAKKLEQELENTENELWLSPITTWEVMILAEKGRIELDDRPDVWIRNVLERILFREAPLTHEVAMLSRVIELPHQDPADRFIAATAAAYGLTLMTADRNLIVGAKNYSVFPNRD